MDLNWTMLAERRMLAALAEGKLSHLAGEGRPLPEAPSSLFVDPTEAIGMRLMAEAGYLPEEIRLRRELEALRPELRAARAPEARRALMARVADLELREAIAREARLHLTRRPHH